MGALNHSRGDNSANPLRNYDKLRSPYSKASDVQETTGSHDNRMFFFATKSPSLPFPYRYTRTQIATIRHFGGLRKFRAGLREPGLKEDFGNTRADVFVCFTNRCGSNYLTHLLASTGLMKKGGEVFNRDRVARISKRNKIANFNHFCQFVRRSHRADSGISSLKVSWHQLYFLHQYHLIPEVFQSPRFVFLRRRDILGQAVSYSIAQQTKAWTSKHESEVNSSHYDEAQILQFVERIATSNAHMEALLSLVDAPVCEIYYEDLIAAPQKTIRQVYSDLGLTEELGLAPEDIKIKLAKVPLKKQGNQLNAEYCRAVRRSFSYD